MHVSISLVRNCNLKSPSGRKHINISSCVRTCTSYEFIELKEWHSISGFQNCEPLEPDSG